MQLHEKFWHSLKRIKFGPNVKTVGKMWKSDEYSGRDSSEERRGSRRGRLESKIVTTRYVTYGTYISFTISIHILELLQIFFRNKHKKPNKFRNRIDSIIEINAERTEKLAEKGPFPVDFKKVPIQSYFSMWYRLYISP